MNSTLEKYHVRIHWDVTHDWSGWIEADHWSQAGAIFVRKLRARKIEIPENATMTIRALDNKKCCMPLSEPSLELS